MEDATISVNATYILSNKWSFHVMVCALGCILYLFTLYVFFKQKWVHFHSGYFTILRPLKEIQWMICTIAFYTSQSACQWILFYPHVSHPELLCIAKDAATFLWRQGVEQTSLRYMGRGWSIGLFCGHSTTSIWDTCTQQTAICGFSSLR
jgi:hypothetical protein